jgi:hypothetical protein
MQSKDFLRGFVRAAVFLATSQGAATLALVLLVGFAVPSARAGQWNSDALISDEGRFEAFRDRILDIDKASGDNFFNSGRGFDVFVSVGPFNDLVFDARRNIDACIRFLSEPSHTAKQRRIAILSMHELGIGDYVIFVRKLVDLFIASKATEGELFDAIYHTPPYWDVPTAHFDDLRIRPVLLFIAGLPGVAPKNKQLLFATLSGDKWINQQEGCCAMGPPPPLPQAAIPREFALLTRLFSWEDFEPMKDRRAWAAAVVENSDRNQNAVVADFLDKALAPPGGMSGYDPRHLWQIYSPAFARAGSDEMRVFLTEIRDAIRAEEGEHRKLLNPPEAFVRITRSFNQGDFVWGAPHLASGFENAAGSSDPLSGETTTLRRYVSLLLSEPDDQTLEDAWRAANPAIGQIDPGVVRAVLEGLREELDTRDRTAHRK